MWTVGTRNLMMVLKGNWGEMWFSEKNLKLAMILGNGWWTGRVDEKS